MKSSIAALVAIVQAQEISPQLQDMLPLFGAWKWQSALIMDADA